MRQKISLSRWNIGETSQRSIGDYDQALHAGTCRFLNNFVISETGKLWRRPGYIHHNTLDSANVRLIPLYLRNDTLILVTYLTGTYPDQDLVFDWYKLESGKFVKQNTPDPIHIYDFKAADFGADRPNTVDLKRLSWVQVESDKQYLSLVHPNMEDPHDIIFDISTETFTDPCPAYTDSATYFDIDYDGTDWEKLPSLLTLGGGTTGAAGDVGWVPFTGLESASPTYAQNPSDPLSFKYLAAITWAYQRQIFARGSYVFGSATADPTQIGVQYNTDIGSDIELDATKLIASDPFAYKLGSDLGYEDIAWLASGSLLMAGANNGAWVLSDAQAGGLDATSPRFYKSSSNGAHWVPGKVIGDAMIFFQRPGRQLNEFLFANASQNYVTTNLSEFSDHLFYDSVPVELQVQRSPFNVAWIIREDGLLVSFTYDRPRNIYGWARHSFDLDVSVDTPFSHGKVNSMCIYSDGIFDAPVIATTRPYTTSEGSPGEYYGLEMMDEYTPDQISGAFVDSAVKQTLHTEVAIIDIVEDATDGHWLYIETPDDEFVDADILNIVGAARTEDAIQDVSENKYDYIYGEWTIQDYDAVLHRFRIHDKTGEPYKGIFAHIDDPATEFAYTSFGSARVVSLHPPVPADYAHLSGIRCRCLMDGNPKSIYVSYDAATFYLDESIPDDWSGDESELTANNVYWNDIIIGRPYESLFSPFVMKKQIDKGKLSSIELEVFRSLGGKVGTASVSLDNELEDVRTVDLVYPALFEDDRLYTGTLEPKVTGGYGDDPLWFIVVTDAVPFNITNAIYTVEAN